MALHDPLSTLMGKTPQPFKVTQHMRYQMTVGADGSGNVVLTFTDPDDTAHAYPMPRHHVVGLMSRLDDLLDKQTTGRN